MLARLECALGPRTAQALCFSHSQNGEMNWPSKVIEYVCIQPNKGEKCSSKWFTSSRGTTGLCAEGEGDYYFFFLFNGCFVFVHGLQHYYLVVGNLSALKLVFFHSIILGLVNHTSWLCGQYL